MPFPSQTRTLVVLALAVITAVVPARAQSSTTARYTIRNLSPGIPRSINNAGEVAGIQYILRPNGVSGSQAAVFRGGAWVLIDDLSDPFPDNGFNSYSLLMGINDLGQAVGYSYKIIDPVSPYDTLYRGATVGRDELALSELPLEADVYPEAINASGRVVGSRDQYLDPYPDYNDAVAFDMQSDHVIDLAALLPAPREDSYAKDVNKGGDVVGYAWITGQAWRSFLYREDASSLQMLESPDGSHVSWALAINDRRVIAGQGVLAGIGSRQAVLFDTDTGTISGLGMPQNALFSQANDLNSGGDVVGSMALNPGGDRAFLYRDGVLHDLNDLIPAASGWTLRDAYSINDKGQIVGFGNPPGSPNQIGYYLLTPTPPSLVGDLIGAVLDLLEGGVLGAGNANALIVKLEGAISQLEKGNTGPAVNKIEAFVNQVQALMQSGELTAEQGQPLIDAATEIITALGS